MPDGMAALERLGITFGSQECHPLRGVRFLTSGLAADAEFPGTCGFGVRRTTLHRIMTESAQSMGGELLWRTPDTPISPESATVGNRRVNATWIVVPDVVNTLVHRCPIPA